jgi:hypothetical protein
MALEYPAEKARKGRNPAVPDYGPAGIVNSFGCFKNINIFVTS